MNALLPPNLLPIPEIEIDSTVFLFALGLAVATGLLFGLAPAWHAARADLNEVLKQATRSSTGATAAAQERPRRRGACARDDPPCGRWTARRRACCDSSTSRSASVPIDCLTFQLSLPQTRYADARGAAFYHDLR